MKFIISSLTRTIISNSSAAITGFKYKDNLLSIWSNATILKGQAGTFKNYNIHIYYMIKIDKIEPNSAVQARDLKE